MPPRNSVSADRNSIHQFLAGYADGKYSDSGVERDFETGRYIVVLPRSASDVTDRAIKMLESRIGKDVGLVASVIRLAGGSNESVSDVLFQALQKTFGGGLEDVILAVDGGLCNVILLLDSADSTPKKEAEELVRKRIGSILKSLDMRAGGISYAMLRDNVPSEHQIIRYISTLSPVSVDGLHKRIGEAGFTVPSTRWLNSKLDYLARRDFLVFQQGAGFALTESGLALLPKQHHRNSPDVQRALALARRNWVR